jgi:hypothetical protein
MIAAAAPPATAGWSKPPAPRAKAGDAVRTDVIDAAAGICDAFGDWQAAQQQWGGRFGTDLNEACR